NLLPLIKTELKDGHLRIYSEESYSTKIGVKIKASTQSLSLLSGSGATNSTIAGIQGPQLEVRLSGASRAVLSGQADNVVIDLSGASQAKTTQLQAKEMKAELTGASQAEVQVAQALKVNASGA